MVSGERPKYSIHSQSSPDAWRPRRQQKSKKEGAAKLIEEAAVETLVAISIRSNSIALNDEDEGGAEEVLVCWQERRGGSSGRSVDGDDIPSLLLLPSGTSQTSPPPRLPSETLAQEQSRTSR
jgi:hypothetical protein